MQAQGNFELPVHIKRYSDRAISVWVGDFIQTTVVTALATEKGIVIIDTNRSWNITAKLKERIKKEFGREDFIYLINTHFHQDHTFGNQIFKDAVIIGHENFKKDYLYDVDFNKSYVRRAIDRIPEFEARLDTLEVNSREAKRLNETIKMIKHSRIDFEKGFFPESPHLTFNDKLILHLGDLSVEMYYLGGFHTGADIVIYIPDEEILITGDLFSNRWIPSFVDYYDADYSLTLKNWAELLNSDIKVRHVITGHWDNELSFIDFQNYFNYVKKLWDDTHLSIKENWTLEELFNKLDITTCFPDLKGRRYKFRDSNLHENNIRFIRKKAEGIANAAHYLQNLVYNEGLEKALEKYNKMLNKDNDKLYYIERHFNHNAKALMLNGKIREALEMYKIAGEKFSKSPLIYLNLAEIYEKTGNIAKAIENYEKTVELDRDNKIAIDKIKTLKKE